jgi:DNA-binding NtrC family response regulator
MTAIRRQRYDVIITPVQGTGVDVLAVLAVAQQTQPLTPVLIIMRADQVAPAVQAFLVGAFDVLPDASEDRVVGWVHTALTVSRLRRHVRWRARELDRLRQGVTKSDQGLRPGELQHRMLPSSSATAVAQASDLAMVVRHKEAILARKRSRLQKLERQVYQTAWLKLYALLSSC